MRFHPEEYKSAVMYWEKKTFPGLTPEQRQAITDKGRDMIKFHLRHTAAHSFINISVFIFIFAADWWVLLRLAGHMSSPIIAAITAGLLHSYLMYVLSVFTLHEGAAHKLIFLRNGRLSGFLGVIANNLNRIALAESDYYARNHLAHHAHFTTTEDQEFLNFVFPKRFLRAFIPFASIFDFTDFKAHSDIVWTRSRFLSVGLFVLYHGIYAMPMALRYGWVFVIIALLIIGLNVTFWLDRLRQYTEHNLMPLNVVNGARDLGLGFWGMLIGGGPCGQPCHWTHHLYPGLPWYNQLRLHNFVRTILTDEQKKVFFLKPFSGFPETLLSAIRTTTKYEI